jgi:hypothetical protein
MALSKWMNVQKHEVKEQGDPKFSGPGAKLNVGVLQNNNQLDVKLLMTWLDN